MKSNPSYYEQSSAFANSIEALSFGRRIYVRLALASAFGKPIVTVQSYGRNRFIHERWERKSGTIVRTDWVKEHAMRNDDLHELFTSLYAGACKR